MRTSIRFSWPLMLLAACAGAPSSDVDDTDDSDVLDTDDTGADTDSTDTDDTDGDTDDTDTLPAFVEWNTAKWNTDWQDALTINTGANGGDGTVKIALETIKVGGPVALYLGSTRFTKDWDEEHTLAQASADTGGAFATYERTLNCGATAMAQTADTSTLFKCSASSNHFLDGEANQQVTLAVAVWPETAVDTTGAPDDCIVFGHDPDALLGSSVPSGLNPPAWLTSANCRDVNP